MKPKISNRKLIFSITLMTICGVLLFPVKETCGTAADFSCAAPPIEPNDMAVYYYAVQPFGISLLEKITQTNIEWLEYETGEEAR